MASRPAVLFDLDGTLTDTWEDIAFSLNATLAKLGRPPRAADEVRRFIGDGFRTLLERALGTSDDAAVGKAVALFDPHYLEHCADHAVLYPGVRQTLEHLADKSLGVVTNKAQRQSERTLKALGIEGFFKTVLGGDVLPVRKPRPEPLWEAARRLGARPEEAWMVGDSPGDVLAGKAAGMRTVAVTYGYRPEEELRAAAPDFIVNRIEDLLPLLGKA